jgi:hypothetical protein
MTLLSGDVHYAGVKKPAVNQLTSKGGVLRDAIKTAIGVKAQRFEDANVMRAVLEA